MRLLRVWIDGYRNLNDVTVDFSENDLTTVIIGENGTGKSNLIEAIVKVFQSLDLGSGNPGFAYDFQYICRGEKISVSNKTGKFRGYHGKGYNSAIVLVRGKKFLPELIFGYYSGTNRRLEALFDAHQKRYYDVINKHKPEAEYSAAERERRLFYCRPIHGVLALLANFSKMSDGDATKELLASKLKITGFHSALAHLKVPSWFQGSKVAAEREASNLWGARGPAGRCARALHNVAFHPLVLEGSVIDDYRRRASKEAQLACFIRDEESLIKFAANYDNDKDMFSALEAADISDLFREMVVWVKRDKDESGNISFSDLSDGERQLLMVLGLIRVSRGKEALFLLDEPDTHLNPAWQLTYLELIREWTEVAADEDKCQIIMSSHNPLTIAALTKKEVRVMQKAADDQIVVSEPYADPRGLGFTSTLTEIFGLPTTLDPETQKQIDARNTLARIDKRSEDQDRKLIELNDKLDRLGFLHESRDPLYDDFLKAVHDYKYEDRPVMTQDQIEKRRLAMQALIKSLSTEQGKAH